MTKDKALKLALEALHYCEALNRPVHEQKIHAIAAIKEALAQPDAFEQGRQEGMKQERALWELSKIGQEIEAQRPWVGLTDEEIDKTNETQVWDARRSYARAIEAKLKEKNA